MKKVYVISLVIFGVLLIGIIISNAYEMKQQQFHTNQIDELNKQLSELEQKCEKEKNLCKQVQYHALRRNASLFGGFPQRHNKEAKEEMQLILDKIRDYHCNDKWDGSDGINSLEKKIKGIKSQIEFHEGKLKK